MERVLFGLVLILAVAVLPSGAQSTPTYTPLSVEDVLKMSQDRFSEDVIITKIRKNGKPFDLSPDELVILKNSGVTDNVIKFLLDPSLPYAPNPEKVSVLAKKYPDDPYASRVPPEPGLYRFSGDMPAAIDIKLLLGEKQGAGLGKMLMKKGKVTAYLMGATAKTRCTDTPSGFYLRLAEQKGIEEVLLIAFETKKNRRELDMGPPGPKPELKPETVRQFDSQEVGAGLFRLVPTGLVKGEYMFYLLSSAEPAKGNYGKGYDFGVGPTGPEKPKP